MDEGPEYFRGFIWREIASLVALPVFAFMLWMAPVTDSWSLLQWTLLAAAAAACVAAYVARALARARITLDDHGVTLWQVGSWRTHAWADLRTIRQIGAYRVRMCFHGDAHEHVAVDVLRSDAFLEAVVDWHEQLIGTELKVNEPYAPEAA
jgi:hypothetical protein